MAAPVVSSDRYSCSYAESITLLPHGFRHVAGPQIKRGRSTIYSAPPEVPERPGPARADTTGWI